MAHFLVRCPFYDLLVLWSPGVYFDFAINGSRTVFLSLRNNDDILATPTAVDAKTLLPAGIDFLVRIDEDDYHVISNSSSVVSICSGDLGLNSSHTIRVIAPNNEPTTTLRVDGIWLDGTGELLPLPTIKSLLEEQTSPQMSNRFKVLEVVTDMSGLTSRKGRKNKAAFHGILKGVLGWEYLLGEMFG
jgi:hypothetical protein